MRKVSIVLQIILYVILLMLVMCSDYCFEYVKIIFASIVVGIMIWNMIKYINKKNSEKVNILSLILGVFILIWELATTYFQVLNPILFPMPEEVIYSYIVQFEYLVECMCSSLKLIVTGYMYAVPIGLGLGVLVGWKKGLRDIVIPIVKILSSIPPIIYAPYLIAVAPSFRGASILLLSMTMFWSIFMSTVSRVENMDNRILHTIKPLKLDAKAMIIHILIPYVFPGTIVGLKVSFSMSFVMLVFAEMVGASAGLGYFIKLYSDYANYANVVAGIILVAILILIINNLFVFLERRFVKW